MAGGFLMGLGQGLQGASGALSDYLARQRQAQQDQMQNALLTAQTSHLNAQTKDATDKSALQMAMLSKYFPEMFSARQGMPQNVGTPVQPPAPPPPVPDIPVAPPGFKAASVAPPPAAAAPAPPTPTPGPQAANFSDLNTPEGRFILDNVFGVNANTVFGPNAENKPPLAATQRGLAAAYSTQGILKQLGELTKGHNPEDPTGEHMGVGHAIQDKWTQFVQGAKYKMGLPVHGGLTQDDERLKQLSALADVMGAIPYMANSRAFQMYREVVKHLPDWNATPEATQQRINTMLTTLPDIIEDMKIAGMPIREQERLMAERLAKQQTAGPVNTDPDKALGALQQAAPKPQPAPGPGVLQTKGAVNLNPSLGGGPGKVMPAGRFATYKAMNPGFSDQELKARLAASGWTVQGN